MRARTRCLAADVTNKRALVPLALHAGVLLSGLALLGIEWHTWLVLLWAPWLEETVFRTGLQQWLQERVADAGFGDRRAVLLPMVCTALAFAIAHALLHPGPWALATAGPALIIGWVYQRHGRLAPCIVLHAFFNLVWFATLSPASRSLSP